METEDEDTTGARPAWAETGSQSQRTVGSADGNDENAGSMIQPFVDVPSGSPQEEEDDDEQLI